MWIYAQRTWLLIAAVTLLLAAGFAIGAPPHSAKTPSLTNQTRSNETVVVGVRGTDRRFRKNPTNPCAAGSECLFFILCEHGTIMMHPNGLAFRGNDINNQCPYFDDVCCKPSMPHIERYLSQVKTKKHQIRN